MSVLCALKSPLAGGHTLLGGKVLCTLAGLGSWEAGRMIRSGADRKGKAAESNLKMLKFTEPVGQERGGEEGWKEMESKRLVGGDGCMKAALEKELIERRALPKG